METFQQILSKKEYNAFLNGVADGTTVSIDKWVAVKVPELLN